MRKKLYTVEPYLSKFGEIAARPDSVNESAKKSGSLSPMYTNFCIFMHLYYCYVIGATEQTRVLRFVVMKLEHIRDKICTYARVFLRSTSQSVVLWPQIRIHVFGLMP